MPARSRGAGDALAAHYEAVGRVVVASATLENRLAEQIRFLVTPEPLVARILTSRMGFRSSLEILGALIAHRTSKPQVLTHFRVFAKKSQDAMDRRNFFAHSQWGVTVKDEMVSVATHKPHRRYGVLLESGTFSAETLLGLAKELDECIDLAHTLRSYLIGYSHGVATLSHKADGSTVTLDIPPILQDPDLPSGGFYRKRER